MRDFKESFKWQKKAADAGHPLAIFNVGELEEVAIAAMIIGFIIIHIIVIVVRAVVTGPMIVVTLIKALAVMTIMIVALTMTNIAISLLKVLYNVVNKNIILL